MGRMVKTVWGDELVIESREVIKFGVLSAILSMFLDAAMGHGLFWRNDPYWTYWITDAFLITTITCLGISLIGLGIWQGFVIIAVQALVLEIYYEFLSPVGLPQAPYWLSFYDIWTTGLGVHFLVYLSGFLLALWIWRRKKRNKDLLATTQPWKIAVYTLFSALGIILLDGLVTHYLLINQYPGFTFFLQRLILTFVFLYAWNSYVGIDLKGIISGAVLLSLLWLTYNMYLGPVGLPGKHPIFFDYDELWFKIFPGALVSTFVGLFVGKWFNPGRPGAA